MIEVCNCGGGPHTVKRNLVCPRVPPAPVYKRGEEEAGQQGARQVEGSPTRTPVLVGFGPTLFSFYQIFFETILLPDGEKGKERE